MAKHKNSNSKKIIVNEPLIQLTKASIANVTMYNNNKNENKNFRIKHQSNSPYKKDYTPTKNVNSFSKTLYGLNFAHHVGKKDHGQDTNFSLKNNADIDFSRFARLPS